MIDVCCPGSHDNYSDCCLATETLPRGEPSTTSRLSLQADLPTARENSPASSQYVLRTLRVSGKIEVAAARNTRHGGI
jgi:hypothetical protein